MDAFHYVPDRPHNSAYWRMTYDASQDSWKQVCDLISTDAVGTCRIKDITAECILRSDNRGYYLEITDTRGINLGHALHIRGVTSHTWIGIDFIPYEDRLQAIKWVFSRKAIVEGLVESEIWTSHVKVRLHTFDIVHDSILTNGDAFCVIRASSSRIPSLVSIHNSTMYHLHSTTFAGGCYFLHMLDIFAQEKFVSFESASSHLSLIYRLLSPSLGTHSDFFMVTHRINDQTRTKVSASYPLSFKIPNARTLQPNRPADFFNRIVRFCHEHESVAREICPPLHMYSNNATYYTENFLSIFMCLEGIVTAVATDQEKHLSPFEMDQLSKDAMFKIISNMDGLTSSHKKRLKEAIKSQAAGKPRQGAAGLISAVLKRHNADTSCFDMKDLEHLASCRNSVAHTTRLEENLYNFGEQHIEEVARRVVDSMFCSIIGYQGGLTQRYTALSKYVQDPEIEF